MAGEGGTDHGGLEQGWPRAVCDGGRLKRVNHVTRQEHLDWAKQRALEYVDRGELAQAFASIVSDLSKHDETSGHLGIELGASLLFSGFLSTPEAMKEFIMGFN